MVFQPTQIRSSGDCPTRLLSDVPSGQDAFGGHQRIAAAIEELVRSETGGRAIALIGGWGSGKSTVVRILCGSFAGSQEIASIVFDAWAHKGDYLRRSFLETLISEFGQERSWLPQEVAEEERARLSGHTKERTTRRNARLTPMGLLLLLGAFVFPLGVTLLSKAEYLPEWTLWLGVALCSLIPAAFMLIVLACWLHPHQSDTILGWLGIASEDDTRSTKPTSYSLMHRLSVLASGGTERVEEKCYEMPSPTPLEFQKSFSRILGQVLEPENRRVVIVIDNLDRVDSKAAREVWVTLQTFFGASDRRGTDVIRRRLWLLVPFDDGMPKQLWVGSEDRGGEDLGDRFVEKTFQAQFRVPKPMLSQWKRFLIAGLREALPRHDETDFPRAYRVFDQFGDNIPPTPREMKRFINNLGAIHRVWGDGIPLQVQALYVLVAGKLDRDRFLDSVLEEVPEGKRSILQESRWIDYIASIHHGVPVEDALEITLRNPIRRSLESGNSDNLERLALDVSGFGAVLERVVRMEGPNWASEWPDQVLAACQAMERLEDTPDVRAAFETLRRCLLRQDKLAFRGTAAPTGLSCLLQRIPSDQLQSTTKSILEKLDVPEPVLDDAESSATARWAGFLLRIAKCLIEQLRLGDLISRHLRVPGDPHTCLAVYRHLSEAGHTRDEICLLAPSRPLPEILDEFIEYLRVANPSPSLVRQAGAVIDVCSRAQNLKDQGSLEKQEPRTHEIVGLLVRKLGPDEADLDMLGYCNGVIDLLLDMVKNHTPEADVELRSFARGERLRTLLDHALATENWDTVAGIAVILLLYNPTAEQDDSETIMSPAGHNLQLLLGKNPGDHNEDTWDATLLKRLTERILQLGVMQRILDVSCVLPAGIPLVEAVLADVHSREDALTHISIQFVAKNRENLLRLYPSAYAALIEIAAQRAELAVVLENLGDARKRSIVAYEAWTRAFAIDRPRFCELLVLALRTLQEDVWRAELTDPSELSTVLRTLTRGQVPVNLGEPLGLALIEHAIMLIENEDQTPASSRVLRSCMEALSPQVFDSTDDALVALIVESAVKPLDRFLDGFGRHLEDSPRVKARASAVLKAVVLPILSRKSLVELRWLKAMRQRGLFDRIRSDFYQKLRPQVREIRERSRGDQSQEAKLVRSIASAFWRTQKPRRRRKPSREAGRQRKPR